MAIGFPPSPPHFRGRDNQIRRFSARLAHFRFFLYSGHVGIGKTSLLLRLAKACKELDTISSGLYLPLSAGETLQSVCVRVKKAIGRTSMADRDNPYEGLLDILSEAKLALFLDDAHHLGTGELATLARVSSGVDGPYRLVVASEVEPEFSVRERQGLNTERLGALTAVDAGAIASDFGVPSDVQAEILRDIKRGGVCGHPLMLRLILTFLPGRFPARAELQKMSARSQSSLKTVLAWVRPHMSASQKKMLGGLGRLAHPIPMTTARQLFGDASAGLVAQGLVERVGEHVLLNRALGQAFVDDGELEPEAWIVAATAIDGLGQGDLGVQASLRAAEIFAWAGQKDRAVDALDAAWDLAQKMGLSQRYLTVLSALSGEGALAHRLSLLRLRARLKPGQTDGRAALESLSTCGDAWSEARALASLVDAAWWEKDAEAAVAAYTRLMASGGPEALIRSRGPIAAEAMLRLGDAEKAQALIQSLLTAGADEAAADLQMLTARVHGDAGRTQEAVAAATAAIAAFAASGRHDEACRAQLLAGDLHRLAGAYAEANATYAACMAAASEAGEQMFVLLAKISCAQTALELGDLASAAKTLDEVDGALEVSPEVEVRRALAGSRALLLAGRGQHAAAAQALEDALRSYSYEPVVADRLRAAQVRSLITQRQFEKAQMLVDGALRRLDPENAGLRYAAFLREGALISLAQGETQDALELLDRACELFARSGNVREEALTLHRLARVAFEVGHFDLAKQRAEASRALAQKIGHERAEALAYEILARVALVTSQLVEAGGHIKSALQSLRRLGDDLGVLHLSELMLRWQVCSGDLNGAMRLGPKLREHAQRLEHWDIRIRAIILTGAALLRRYHVDAAQACFKALPAHALSPITMAMMWRLGEALASVDGKRRGVLERRARWAGILSGLPANARAEGLQVLSDMVLPPHDRCHMRQGEESKDAKPTLVGSEALGILRPKEHPVFIDVLNRRAFIEGSRMAFEAPPAARVFFRLAVVAPARLPVSQIWEDILGHRGEKVGKKVLQGIVAQINHALDGQTQLRLDWDESLGGCLRLPQDALVLVPTTLSIPDLSPLQKRIIKLMRKLGTVPLQSIQEVCGMDKTQIKTELDPLLAEGVVIAVKDGRGQVFRLGL